MYNSRNLGIVQKQKDYNMQSTFRDAPNVPIDSNYNNKLDWKLAKVLYYYLNGTINGLPKHEYIEKLSKDTDDDHTIISSCCGLSINKGLKVSIDTPIKENNEIKRIDIISEDGYDAFKMITERVDRRKTIDKCVDIDIDKEPRFEKERIERLVKYLDNYNKMHNKEEKEKQI